MKRALSITLTWVALCTAAPGGRVAATETKSGGNWFDDTTWTQGVPGGWDWATINGGHNLSVDRIGAGAYNVFNSGVIDVKAEPPPSQQAGILSIGAMYVGYTADGQVLLGSGGQVYSNTVWLGYALGWRAAVTIDGAPNQTGGRAMWTNSGDFVVGSSGYGPGVATVVLTSGGQIKSNNTWIGSATSSGTVQVNNSTWTNTSLFRVGWGGPQSTLSIINRGTVNDLSGMIGDQSGLSSAILDNGTWNNAGDFYVGVNGQAQLTAVNGGKITNTNGYIGSGVASVATATIRGATWVNSAGLVVGLDGDGSLLIEDGGKVTSTLGIIGRYGQSKGTVAVDNASWANAGSLYVGHGITGLPGSRAIGQMAIRNGGNVISTAGSIGKAEGSTGTVEVKGMHADGWASTWSAGSELRIGERGTGTLTVSDGGVVKSALTILGGGSGTLQLDGTVGRRGALETGQVLQVNGAISFNGGIVRATADQADFLRQVGAVAVQANGVFVDSNNHSIGIGAGFTGSGGLTKLGQGALDLRGISFLGGLSMVEAGILRVNGTLSGDVQVNDGATLGGSGQIIGAVNVLPGGALSPGNSPGTLTIGALTLGPRSVLNIEFGPVSDHIIVNGDVTLDGTINFFGSAAFFSGGALSSFISYSGALVNNGVVIGSLPDGVERTGLTLDFGTPGFVGMGFAPSPVPEPESFAMMIAGLGILGVAARRRKQKEASRLLSGGPACLGSDSMVISLLTS